MQPLDTIVFETDLVRVGKFRCAVSHRQFRDSGPTAGHLVVFPRSAVWIQQAGSEPFLADPRVATIYNREQEYTREAAAGDGDRCDWFSVSPALAREIACAFDPSVDDAARPFTSEFAAVDHGLYLRQRLLLAALERDAVDILEAEERVIGIVAAVIRSAAAQRARERNTRGRSIRESHRLLADRARAAIARDVAARPTVATLARALGVSPFHLCRVFRQQTGVTLHTYRTQVRVNVALERVVASGADVSRVALDLGFASHSHFTATFGKYLHTTPSAVRASLLAARAAA